MVTATSFPAVPRWSSFERTFISQWKYDHPVQDVRLTVTFTSPSGATHTVEGFWDGAQVWRVRFAPDELGIWTYISHSADQHDEGLHERTGRFQCVRPKPRTCFEQHGPVRIAPHRRCLEHADGTPFFWVGDTAWNGPLLASASDWNTYLHVRSKQKFTAVQWVATQWLTSPDGDYQGRRPYHGDHILEIDPLFFQQLDAKCRAINRFGLLSVPAMLWAAEWSDNEAERQINPGVSLSETQAITLARYMLARWGAYHVVWILPADGDYTGARADRWKRIGKAVFADQAHAPVVLHPKGWSDPYSGFAHETWLDIMGYQSSHSSDDDSLRWLLDGKPARSWAILPPRPVLNLEPAYENHADLANLSVRWSSADVRRILYWSLLVAPTAGVTYGGHGVWGWDDGKHPPKAHPHSGVPLSWRNALRMEAAEQIANLSDCFNAIEWWQLRPDRSMVVVQPGEVDVKQTICAARSSEGNLAIVYIPHGCRITLNLEALKPDLSVFWFNPRTGDRFPAAYPDDHAISEFETPDTEDWVLVFKSHISIPIGHIPETHLDVNG